MVQLCAPDEMTLDLQTQTNASSKQSLGPRADNARNVLALARSWGRLCGGDGCVPLPRRFTVSRQLAGGGRRLRTSCRSLPECRLHSPAAGK